MNNANKEIFRRLRLKVPQVGDFYTVFLNKVEARVDYGLDFGLAVSTVAREMCGEDYSRCKRIVGLMIDLLYEINQEVKREEPSIWKRIKDIFVKGT